MIRKYAEIPTKRVSLHALLCSVDDGTPTWKWLDEGRRECERPGWLVNERVASWPDISVHGASRSCTATFFVIDGDTRLEVQLDARCPTTLVGQAWESFNTPLFLYWALGGKVTHE